MRTFRFLSLLSIVGVCSTALCLFLVHHGSDFVIVTNFQRFEPEHVWNTFKVFNTSFYRYLSYIPIYIYVCALLVGILLIWLDYEIGIIYIGGYVIVCLCIGCHYEILNLMANGSMYLLDFQYIQLELIYSEDILKLEASRYLLELNQEWSSHYLLNETLLNEWIKNACGRKSVLMSQLVVYYAKKQLLKKQSVYRIEYLEKNMLFCFFRNVWDFVFGNNKK